MEKLDELSRNLKNTLVNEFGMEYKQRNSVSGLRDYFERDCRIFKKIFSFFLPCPSASNHIFFGWATLT